MGQTQETHGCTDYVQQNKVGFHGHDVKDRFFGVG